METFSGIKAYPLAMTAEMVSWKDITTSLSRMPRYYGHTFISYNVLEHSWLVAKLVQMRGAPPEVTLGALLHDAKEAYIGDIATPIKHCLGEIVHIENGDEDYQYVFERAIKRLEEGVDAAICAAVGCLDLEDMYHEIVKQADVDMLAFEASQIVHSKGREWRFSRRPMEIPAALIADHGPIGHYSAYQLVNRVNQMYDQLVEEIRR